MVFERRIVDNDYCCCLSEAFLFAEVKFRVLTMIEQRLRRMMGLLIRFVSYENFSVLIGSEWELSQ